MIDGMAATKAGATAKKMAAKVSDGVGLRGPKGFRDRRGPALRGRGYCSRAGLGVDRQSFARPAYRPSNPPAFLAAAAAWFIVIRHVGKLAARPADALLAPDGWCGVLALDRATEER